MVDANILETKLIQNKTKKPLTSESNVQKSRGNSMSMFRRGLPFVRALALLLVLASSPVQATVETVFHFSSRSAGAGPYGGLVQGIDGKFYGTTYGGGTSDVGTVFRIAPDGTGYTVLHSFNSSNGARPLGGLVQGTDGNLYGMTSRGGMSDYGTVFRIAPDGTGYTVLHYFNSSNGAYPQGDLVQGADGNLYGTTYLGGTSNVGTVFRIAPDGTGQTVLHSFEFRGGGIGGFWPFAGLIQGTDGTLYGTTAYGGTSGYGTVFRIAPDGQGHAVLHSFNKSDGGNPVASLVQEADGKLYGTTYLGGTSDNGTVFRIAPDGTDYAILHSFNSSDGANPRAGSLVRGTDGSLYGTTLYGGSSDRGTVFRIALDGTGHIVLRSFKSSNGANPWAGLAQSTDGTVYGTTVGGGAADFGTIFSVTTLVSDTVPDAFKFRDMVVTAPNSEVQSNFVTVTGINTPSVVKVANGEYRIGSRGTWRVTAGTVDPGETIQVRHTSSMVPTGIVNTTLTVGGISDTFTSTLLFKLNPNSFKFQDVTGVDPGTVVTSNQVAISGMTLPTTIEVAGGEYRIGSGDWTSDVGVVQNEDRVKVRHTSAGTANTNRNTTLTVGNYSDTFTSKTR